jgi:hypothetical protein
MPTVTVSLTDKDGKDLQEQAEFEFKYEKGEVKATLKTKKKKDEKWSDPKPANYPSATFGQTPASKTEAGFKDALTTVYDQNGGVAIEVHCPHPDDKNTKPSITYAGAPYYVSRSDQDKLVAALKGLNVKKK